jgi:hypothetical protein
MNAPSSELRWHKFTKSITHAGSSQVNCGPGNNQILTTAKRAATSGWMERFDAEQRPAGRQVEALAGGPYKWLKKGEAALRAEPGSRRAGFVRDGVRARGNRSQADCAYARSAEVLRLRSGFRQRAQTITPARQNRPCWGPKRRPLNASSLKRSDRRSRAQKKGEAGDPARHASRCTRVLRAMG